MTEVVLEVECKEFTFLIGFEVELAGFADDSNVGCERKKQVTDDSQAFWPNNWKELLFTQKKKT